VSDRTVNIRIAAKDDATAVVQKVGKEVKKNLGGGSGGLLADLKGNFGRGSDLTQTLKALQGGGAVLGLSLAGKELDGLADKAVQLRKELHEGSKSGGEVAEELAKSIPIFGSLFDAGRKFRSLLDGTADDLARLANENAFGKLLDGQAEAIKRIKKLREEGDESAQRVRDQRALVGLADPGKSLKQLQQERAALQRQAEQNSRDIPAAIAANPKYQVNAEAERAARQALQKAQFELAEARDQVKNTEGFGDKNPARENALENLKTAQGAFNEASVNVTRFNSLRAAQAQETDATIRKSNKELYEKIGLTRQQEGQVERAAQQEREKRTLDHETRIAEIQLKSRTEAFKLAGKDNLADIDTLLTNRRIDQAQSFLKFKQNFVEALHGGPLSPAEVGKQFFTEMLTKGQLTEQQLKDTVGKAVVGKAVGAVKGALDDLAEFKGKDAIDFLLRKAHLKGFQQHNDVPSEPFSVYAEAAQSSGGRGAGQALAEQLAFAGTGSSPAATTAKNTEKTALSIDALQKDFSALKDQLTSFISTIGVAGSDFGSSTASTGGDF
jgi:hypothetical protein